MHSGHSCDLGKPADGQPLLQIVVDEFQGGPDALVERGDGRRGTAGESFAMPCEMPLEHRRPSLGLGVVEAFVAVHDVGQDESEPEQGAVAVRMAECPGGDARKCPTRRAPKLTSGYRCGAAADQVVTYRSLAGIASAQPPPCCFADQELHQPLASTSLPLNT